MNVSCEKSSAEINNEFKRVINYKEGYEKYVIIEDTATNIPLEE